MHRLCKHQTPSTTVLFTTTLTWSIIIIPLTQLCSVIYYFCCATFSSKYCVFVVVVFFGSICSSYMQLFIRYLTSTFSYIKFECFSLYFKSQVLLVDTNTGTPLPFGTLGIHKVLALTVVVGLKKRAVPYVIS